VNKPLVLTEVEIKEIEEMTKRMDKNPLETRINMLEEASDKDEIIKKAILTGPAGVPRKGYEGPVTKVMYVLCDGTGVPGRRAELAGVKGKQSDGSAKTFEAKIGAIFVEEFTGDWKPLLTESGEVYRDKDIKYMGTVRKVDDFGPMLYAFALENGLANMDAVVFLGDGALWLKGIQEKYFPYAITGIDLFHSIEKVGHIADHLQFKGRACANSKKIFEDKCVDLLKQGKVQDMLDFIQTMPPKKGEHQTKLKSALGYFQNNIDRMNYGVFTALGIFVGSGVIEAGCKVIVGTRMKNAGMHWSKDCAEKMISLRCVIRNNKFLSTYLHEPVPALKSAA
jgi:hypothetical protein